MSRPLIERRLRDVGKQLKSLRADLAVTREQLVQLDDEADAARLRALVSEAPGAQRQHRRTARHATRLRRHNDRLIEKITSLESEQDELLDRLTATS